jgi:hypothetical protein
MILASCRSNVPRRNKNALPSGGGAPTPRIGEASFLFCLAPGPVAIVNSFLSEIAAAGKYYDWIVLKRAIEGRRLRLRSISQ